MVSGQELQVQEKRELQKKEEINGSCPYVLTDDRHL